MCAECGLDLSVKRSIEKLRLWLAAVIGALGPVYWFPGILPSTIEVFKSIIALTFIATCLYATKRRVSRSDFICSALALASLAIASIYHSPASTINVALALLMYLFFSICPPFQSLEQIWTVIFRSLTIFAVFPLVLIFDYFSGGIFVNPFYEYIYPLYASGFQGGRTGWAFTCNLALALLISTQISRNAASQATTLIPLFFAIVFNNIIVGSRAGLFVSIALTLIFAAVLIRRNYRFYLPAWAALAVISVAVLYFMGFGNLDQGLRILRLFDQQGWRLISDAARFEAIPYIFSIISENPVWGSGKVDLRLAGFGYEYIHNVWFKVAAENGMPASLLLLLFFVTLTYRILKMGPQFKVFFPLLLVVWAASLFEPTTVFGNLGASMFFWMIVASVRSLGAHKWRQTGRWAPVHA